MDESQRLNKESGRATDLINWPETPRCELILTFILLFGVTAS